MQYVIFAVMLIAFCYVCYIPIRKNLENRKKPRLTVQATVLVRQKARHETMHEGGSSSYTTCHAAFRTESGEELHFQIKPSLYRRIGEGDKGTLTYQGFRLIRFDKD